MPPVVFLLFVSVPLTARAFNLAPDFAQVMSDPTGDLHSRFGFAVALRNQGREGVFQPGILVGAPLGNSGHRKLREVYRPGVVYWCPLFGNQTCKESTIDNRPDHYIEELKGNRSMNFLGSSLDTVDTGNGYVVCAPHWRNEPHIISSNMNGMCYWGDDVETSSDWIFTIYDRDDQVLNDEKETVFYAYGESGFSVSVNQDGSDIIIGAPGVYNWKGAVLRFDLNTKERVHRPLSRDIDRYPNIQNDSYFGYSVAHGFFPESNHTVYLGGAPRAGDLRGKVYMFDFVNNTGVWEYDILKEWEGTQMGEYFGSSMAVADFNKDGYDDVLVGAPQFSLKSRSMTASAGDEGCVYMFLSDPEGGWMDSNKQIKVMGSEKFGAKFGMAISLLGDINMDGYMDVAIGAPYEDEMSGVVYIYHGSKNGLKPEFSQRLVAREINPSLRGFGAALSRGFDVDQNHFNDLAVGAHLSDNVVLIKAYPIVTIHPQVIPSVSKISFSDKQFNATACVTYSGSHAPSKIDVQVTVKADPLYRRAHFLEGLKDLSYNSTLVYGGDPHCQNFTLVIEAQEKFYKPIDIAIEYKLPSQPRGPGATFCKDCPVLNDTQVHHWKFPFRLGCKEDAHCSIDLAMSANFINTTSPFVIGTQESVSIQLVLESRSDPAYSSKISMVFPRVTPHRRIPGDCQENRTAEIGEHLMQLVCDVDGPLKRGMTSSLVLELDMMNVPLNMQELSVNISAISSDEDSDETNNHVQLVLLLRAVVDVNFAGNSVPEQATFVSKKKDSEVEFIQDKDFTHNFLVTNRGPSPVKALALDFRVPYGAQIGSRLVEFLDVSFVDMKRQHLLCRTNRDSDPTEDGVVRSPTNRHAADTRDVSPNRTLALDCSLGHVRCLEVHCVMDQQFLKKTSTVVSFSFKTKLRQAESFLKNKDLIIVTSSGTLRLSETEVEERKVQITLWRTLPSEGVAWWIILLAIIGGVLILAAIIWCFYKFGFFRRDKRMQLQAMKHNTMVENEFLCNDTDADT